MFISQILFIEINLINIFNIKINFVLIIDLVRTLFILCVRIISLAVLKFRQSYIINDVNFTRFHLLLIVFVLRIGILILRPNLIRILLGWDGLGLSSYLLIIYYRNPKAYNSGIITALSNRVGDVLILIRIALLFIFGNWNFIFYLNKEFSGFLIFSLVIAACTKRAQIPFSAWLPAAIAAPTPVSSLVHSSTLVTAGVFLLIRHNEFLLINHISWYLILIGGLTIVIASIRALFEIDIKKMVALSTLRQLGIIILRLGVGAYIVRFFHLLSHAFFKALLFLCVGAIIHRRKDYQDLRLAKRRILTLPVINRFILVSTFSLIGAPFMSAFFSKEIVLELILVNNLNFNLYLIIIWRIFLTTAYRTRLSIFIFREFFNNDLLTFKLEENNLIIKRIFILLIPRILGGFWINFYLWESIKLTSILKFFKVLISLLIVFGITYSIFINLNTWKTKWSLKNWILRSMWILPFFRTQLPSNRLATNRIKFSKFFDRGILKIKIIYFYQISRVIIKSTFTFKIMPKIFILVMIWGAITRFYYLCNNNKI